MRKYLPTLGELIDRLSIVQLKEVKIPKHKEEYAKEISEIVHDINEILKEKPPLNGIRNTAKNKIQELDGGRKDYKIDCIADEFNEWEVSWTK